jgi:hypothetical protein
MKEKWKKLENTQVETVCKQLPFDAIEELSLMLVLVHVEMKKSRAKERIFLFVMILVNGMKKTNVQNCLIY